MEQPLKKSAPKFMNQFIEETHKHSGNFNYFSNLNFSPYKSANKLQPSGSVPKEQLSQSPDRKSREIDIKGFLRNLS